MNSRARALAIAIVGAIVLIVGVIIALKAGGTSPLPSDAPQPTAIATTSVSANNVANQLNCGRFKDLGSAPTAGVVDSGYCFLNGKKYAINTFETKAIRDAWLKAAEPLGVNPKWETDTSVVYPSVPSAS